MEAVIMDPEWVKRSGALWIWLGPKNGAGYPRIPVSLLPDRPEGDTRRYLPGHRFMYELFVDHAPIHACICHRNSVPSDINPSNLFEGTYANNSIHTIMSKRRIYPKGEEHWNSKVTSQDIQTMVNLYYANAKPVYEIADMFDLSIGHTSKLIHGHVREEETRIAREEALSIR